MRELWDTFLSQSRGSLWLTVDRVVTAVQNTASGIQANGTKGLSSYSDLLSLYLPVLVKKKIIKR